MRSEDNNSREDSAFPVLFLISPNRAHGTGNSTSGGDAASRAKLRRQLQESHQTLRSACVPRRHPREGPPLLRRGPCHVAPRDIPTAPHVPLFFTVPLSSEQHRRVSDMR